MSVQIDDNEVVLPLRISTGGEQPPGSGGDALPPAEAAPVDPSPSHDAPGWRPAMELTPAGGAEFCTVSSRSTAPAGVLLSAGADHNFEIEGNAPRSSITEFTRREAPADSVSESREGCEVSEGREVFHRASAIAQFLGISTKQVHRRALAEQWPAQPNANRIDYCPPFEIPSPTSQPSNGRPDSGSRETQEPPTTFTALSLSSRQREKVFAREAAVQHYGKLVANGTPVETALTKTVAHFASTAFLFSVRSLRRWRDAYATLGINGLVDQMQGVVGRKPVARFLSAEQKARLQAESIEHGSKARAGRNLMRDPELHAGARVHLHGAHTSKSYLPPSIREAAKTSPLTAALATGPRAARMMTSSVHSNPESVKCGDVYVADDETPNIYVWEPWPCKLGYRIGRPQILQVADCGSLMPLCIRVIMRASGAYTADDVAGTLGDAFDNPGLPKLGLLLEGGVWRANTVIGHKTNLSVQERIGGLSGLGLQIFHARTPMAKWEIEGQFHLQQHIMDKCPGYCGRNERTDLPEKTKKLLARADTGAVHPSEFLLSMEQFANHVQDGLREFSHERQDGKTLRGASPWEKWQDEKPRLRHIAEKDKWLYRSALCVTTAKKNGELRVTHGSGRNARFFYYHNAALLMPRAGQEIFVYWNDHNPQADCVLLAGTATNPNKRVCIGAAQYVREISRFNADKGELGEAMARKAAELSYAKSELRTIEPHLARTSSPVSADNTARHIGQEIAAASDRAEEQVKRDASVRRSVANAVKAAPVTMEDRAAILSPSPSQGEGRGEDARREFQPEEITSLFGEE